MNMSKIVSAKPLCHLPLGVACATDVLHVQRRAMLCLMYGFLCAGREAMFGSTDGLCTGRAFAQGAVPSTHRHRSTCMGAVLSQEYFASAGCS